MRGSAIRENQQTEINKSFTKQHQKTNRATVIYRRARQPGGEDPFVSPKAIAPESREGFSPPVLIFSRGREAAGVDFIKYFFGKGRGGRQRLYWVIFSAEVISVSSGGATVQNCYGYSLSAM